MKPIESIKKQLFQTQDLSKIITTMKNISIVNITHYERRVRAVRQYYETIEKGFQIFLQKDSETILEDLEKQTKKPPYSLGAVVIGSEKGLCGEFNEKLFQFFKKSVKDRKEVHIIAIGNKITSRLEQYQIQTYDFPSTHEKISGLLSDLLIVIQEWIKEENIGEIAFFHNQIVSLPNYEPRFKSIFPLNLDWLKSLKRKPWPSHCLPTYNMKKEELFYTLAQELLLISMYRSFIESLASENMARLASMQAAENNIEDRLAKLENNYHLQRQAQITEELFDILSGFEELAKRNK
ncbi:MAG: hypothetical protein COT84_04020 [Chlamydiae bacterium CG10_big_fil_rev_8_21_14_0_10_35_9]|nr:MAG: hypothetical protein COT84_04020 [Chlamydiae bacterium CG10_big_fil_rev_8_21_14_0_10_35_9]